ncbi:MAG: PilZ domain-containing protein [Methylococcaceae bacterium]|nr:PilZ domain-containing protein [Methylococcaceae bacterium]
MSEKNVFQVDERRRFFRIDDEINLFYKKVAPESIKKYSEASSELLNNCSLAAALDILNQEAQIIFNRIERNNSDIADYLKVMDSKINLVARAVLMDGTDLINEKARNVSLSASGVAFECEELIAEGEFLEIRLLLTSSMAVVVSYGNAVYSHKKPEAVSDFPYVVGVAFSEMKEQDRELLIKHVVKRQMQQIRKHKEN